MSNNSVPIFVTPLVAEKLLDIAIAKRPQSWGKKSCAPYYKEFYAKWIQKQIDAQLASGQDLTFRYEIFCSDGISETTLYNKINQSIRYLIENLDDNNQTYRKWYSIQKTTKKRNYGITISLPVEFRSVDGGPQPELTVPHDQMPIWERQMNDWLEGSDRRPFVKEHLALNQEEIIKFRTELGSLQGIGASITANSIKIIRL